jgi:hypothetical protein
MAFWQFLLDLRLQLVTSIDYLEHLQLDSLEKQLTEHEKYLQASRNEVSQKKSPSSDILIRNATYVAQEVACAIRDVVISIRDLQVDPDRAELTLPYAGIRELLSICNDAHRLELKLYGRISIDNLLVKAKEAYSTDEFVGQVQKCLEETVHSALHRHLVKFYEHRYILDYGMPIYFSLSKTAGLFSNACQSADALSFPDAIAAALYRNRTPDFNILRQILQMNHDESNSFIDLCKCQLVVVQRLRTFKNNCSSCAPRFDHYLWDLDRMREYRNLLVHEAILSPGLDLIAQRLHQYSRVYLQHIIDRLEDPKKLDVEWFIGSD